MIFEKFKASIIHLTLSVLLVGLVIGSVLFFWFPQVFISITDFKEVATIIILVDLVLGPLLTFVVFQPKKKTLKLDLSIIAAIQLSALFYGIYALYLIHPVYITFNVDRFTMVSAKDAQPEKALLDEYKIMKLSGPQLAFAKIPEDADKRNELTMAAAMGGGDIELRPEYYASYKNNTEEILEKSLDPKVIFSDENTTEKTQSFLEAHSTELDKYVFLPLVGDTKRVILVLSKKFAKPVTTIDRDPWNLTKK